MIVRHRKKITVWKILYKIKQIGCIILKTKVKNLEKVSVKNWW
jgi:hypothetical protein